jgi:hypothetical protein
MLRSKFAISSPADLPAATVHCAAAAAELSLLNDFLPQAPELLDCKRDMDLELSRRPKVAAAVRASRACSSRTDPELLSGAADAPWSVFLKRFEVGDSGPPVAAVIVVVHLQEPKQLGWVMRAASLYKLLLLLTVALPCRLSAGMTTSRPKLDTRRMELERPSRKLEELPASDESSCCLIGSANSWLIAAAIARDLVVASLFANVAGKQSAASNPSLETAAAAADLQRLREGICPLLLQSESTQFPAWM